VARARFGLRRIAARPPVVLEVDGTRDLVDEVAALLEIEPDPIDVVGARRWENEVVAANRRPVDRGAISACRPTSSSRGCANAGEDDARERVLAH
jgi:hypothetical protein